MTSRLERLFLLLETGQSTFLRKSAAFQIGEIVKTHPHDLRQLLDKLKPLVSSNSWDTRIAAAQTIESIVKHLNDFDLTVFDSGESTSNASMLENFNLNKLLTSNAKLLSSNTHKYDVKDIDDEDEDDLLTTSNSKAKNDLLKEKIKHQRKLLNLKLGIDVGDAAKLDTSHIFSDYDLMVSQQSVIEGNGNEAKCSSGIKRKADVSMTVCKQESNDPDYDEEVFIGKTENDSKLSKKIKHESTEIEDEQSSLSSPSVDHVKSLEIFTQWLLSKLFDQEWETRHGAATALREIIKRLVHSFENTFKTSNSSPFSSDLSWFQNCLVKLLSVIALDRFADYVGDEAVAPVRETCAQIIGIISSLFNFKDNLNIMRQLCEIINMFLRERTENCWEVRHSGIMILKYTIAAASTNPYKSDLSLKLIFDLLFENILTCIKDQDDDVRQVASASLEPVSKLLKNLLKENQIESLIRILIDVLSDIDDLGTSSSTIMTLLSDLLTEASNHNENNQEANIKIIFLRLLNNQSIIPRLLPFLQHSSLNIRQTTLNTINKIIIAIDEYHDVSSNENHTFINRFESMETSENLVTLFRMLYQQAILMSSEHAFNLIESTLEKLWTTLCDKLSSGRLINVCFPYISTWLLLLMHPSHQQIDSVYLINNQNQFQISGDQKEYIGSNQVKFEDKQTRDIIQIKCRLLASRLLATLFDRIASIDEIDSNTKERPINAIVQFLSKQINFKSGLQRFCFALLMLEWANKLANTKSATQDSVFALIKENLASRIINCLDDENTIYFDEIAMMFTRLQKECRTLIGNYSKFLIKFNIDLVQSFGHLNVFTFEDVTNLTDLIQDKYLNTPLCNDTNKVMNADLKLAVTNLIELNQQTSHEQETLQLRSCFSLASASIKLNCLCERMNPMIRPLIDCIRFESNQDLQLIASKHLAMLLENCSKRTPNPVPKIFKNLLNYMCNDPTKTPLVQNMPFMGTLPDKDYYDINKFYGILSDLLTINSHHLEEAHKTCSETANTPKSSTKKRTNSVSIEVTSMNNQTNEQTFKLKVEKRGAELTFKSICEVYKDKIELVIPEIIHHPLNQINQILNLTIHTLNTANELTLINELNLDANSNKYQELINALCLVEHICSCNSLDQVFLERFSNEIPNIMKLIGSPLTGLRHLATRCLASICKKQLIKSMSLLLEKTIDCLDNSEFNLFCRQGAIELIFCLFEQLDHLILPFTVIFIVPVLRRMCDLDWYIRSVSSQCFATLVKLYPLGVGNLEHENTLSEITSKNQNILRMKLEQQDFLDQLMDNRKLKPYSLPSQVLIDVNLRPYQQQGVNWLAFLKQFNLHGILCDDMGLGKTLQSICLLAGDHSEKISQMKADQEENTDIFLPSIIICPTTLTNHWYHEIERFVDGKCLRPFIYSGSVCEREQLRKVFFSSSLNNFNFQNISSKSNKSNIQIENIKRSKNNKHRYNVFIVSYEIIRHDIVHLCNQQWNYCILDEGHLIKSSKTKLSKSIKQIRASHRLILTGTPIQNNVTELWCLFDFLLPGYLGTEKQFHAKYAKYIAPPTTSSTLQRSQSHHKSQNSSNNHGKSSNENGNNNHHQQSVIALESLHKQVLPFLLRRTKEEVLKDLPPKIIQDYYCEMSQLQIELYQDFAKSEASDNIKHSLGLLDEDEEQELDEDDDELTTGIKKSISSVVKETPSDKKPGSEHVFQALQYLRKVVNHPSLVMNPDHPKWAKVQADLKATNSNINDIKYSGKLLALRDLLMECGIGLSSNNGGEEDSCVTTNISEFDSGANGSSVLSQHRVLIFCQLKSMIDIIENQLLKKMTNVSHLRLDGTIPASERYGIVKRFNSDPSIDILLLTTSIGGLGLNLTGADTVIFVEHDWNPQKDLQAMDRAHRIGQTKVVNVYRLITKRTIEEKIMSLQKFKLGIANTVVNIENSSLGSMGTEQLMNMFNKDDQIKKEGASSAKQSQSSVGGGSYQRILDSINELWDESQYENEYNLDSFIKSLN